jgi:predicted AlkP superfamily pyrophosphatase or phosphodiesterase
LTGSHPVEDEGVRPAWKREGTLYVIGIDGLTLDIIGPMCERGELPHFAQIAGAGCSGRLQTVSPTNSSLLWTSIATGCHHRRHGIDGFSYYRLLGVRTSRSAVRLLKKVGLKGLLKALEAAGLMKERLLDGRHMRCKPFWDVISEAGGRVGVVNWWHSWPAEPVNGFIVSDRLFHWRSAARGESEAPQSRLTYPPELVEDAARLTTRPDDVSVEDIRPFVNMAAEELEQFLEGDYARHELRGELKFLIALDRTCWRAFEHCLEEFPNPTAAALYVRSPDIAQHCAFHYMPAADQVDVAEEDRRRFGNAVPEAYRTADEMLGKLLARMKGRDTLLVCSDHGFAFQAKRGKYGHARGRPPGVFYALGPEFRAGQGVQDACIYDVAPTLMRLCGLPPSAEIEGRCLEELLTDEFRRTHPPLPPVPTYGPRRTGRQAPFQPEEVDEKIKEHLRALGYLE